MIGGVGRGRGPGEPIGGAEAARAGGTAELDEVQEGGLEHVVPALLEELDALDPGAVATLELPRPLEAALAAPSAGVLAGALDLGRSAAALARIVRRGARPDETLRERKLRELVARYLDLTQEAAAGMGRINVG
jgi:hypothetical protein